MSFFFPDSTCWYLLLHAVLLREVSCAGIVGAIYMYCLEETMETKSSVILSFDTQQCWAGHFAARHPHICHLGASRVDRRVAPPAASAVGDTGTIRHDMISRALVVFVNNNRALKSECNSSFLRHPHSRLVWQRVTRGSMSIFHSPLFA